MCQNGCGAPKVMDNNQHLQRDILYPTHKKEPQDRVATKLLQPTQIQQELIRLSSPYTDLPEAQDRDLAYAAWAAFDLETLLTDFPIDPLLPCCCLPLNTITCTMGPMCIPKHVKNSTVDPMSHAIIKAAPKHGMEEARRKTSYTCIYMR
jgi:hypothetical protein